MDDHFRAFSFVNRITSVQAGVRVQGSYTIPAGLPDFPGSLVAEAVGQLAAWAAMAAHRFERRPVAGLAGSIDLLADVQPGQVIELAAELECADEDAVAYSGCARVNGNPIIRLNDCVGPMVLVEEFDDPQALRNRFEKLCGPGPAPGVFGGLPSLPLTRTGGETARHASAILRVPSSAPFFADHFPRRPVFPGSLLMHANLQLAAELAGELPPPAPGAAWTLRTVQDMKLRAFIPPGSELSIGAKLGNHSAESAAMNVESRNGKEVVGTARLLFVPEGRP